MTMADETRIDRWLCAVRLVKTRPIATQLCEGGHVRVNGNPAKPSTKVRAGDVVHALIAERERIVEVVRPIETRVGAPVAATCYIDNSPPPVSERSRPASRRSAGRAVRANSFAASSSGCGGSDEADINSHPGSRRWRSRTIARARHMGEGRPGADRAQIKEAGRMDERHVGRWWQPQTPEHAVAGELRLTDDRRATLELQEPITNKGAPGKALDVVRGTTVRGETITLSRVESLGNLNGLLTKARRGRTA